MINTKKIIEGYLANNNWRIKENANTSYSYSGMVGHVANYATADYALENIYPPAIEKAHREAYIHIHDLSGGMSCYCLGMDLEQLLTRGLNDIDGPPRHFSSALSQMMNLVFLVSQEIAGACAFNSVDTLLAPYAYQDKLTYNEIKQHIQEFVYSINIKGRIGYQSPFHNMQFDITVPNRKKNTFATVGGEPLDVKYEDLHWQMESITRAFLEVMMESKRTLAFPVINIGITKDFNWDNKLADTIFESIGKIGQPTINNYVNSDYDPDAVKSMCCFDGSQEVMIKKYGYKTDVISLKEVYERFSNNSSIPIYHNGAWEKGRVIRIPADNRTMFKVTTSNNKEMIVTDNHLHATLDGVKSTVSLTENDYLITSTMPCESMYNNLTYEMGVLVGAYLGDGSKTEKETVLSMNEKKCSVLIPLIQTALKQLNVDRNINIYIYDNLHSVRIYGVELPSFISEWVYGNYASEKELNKDVLRASTAFRKGILFGMYSTDGGNSNRIYSTSEKLIKNIEAISTTLGIPTVINTDDRVGEVIEFPDGHKMQRNYPLYCIRLYEFKGKRKYNGVYKTNNNQVGFKVKSIELLNEAPEYVYCFEMEDKEEPFFTLPNGIITHNCSLRLDMKKILKQTGGQFGAADNSGSTGVVTLNLPLYGYLSGGNKDILFQYIDTYTEIAFQALIIKRRFIEEMMKKGLYPNLHRFVDDFRHFFNTIGVIGMNEMLLNMGLEGIDHPESAKFCEEVLEYINEKISEFQVRMKDFYGTNQGLIANLELIPGEGVTRRFAKHMKEKFPDIITANGTGADYLTRGCWLPADKRYSLMEAANHQDVLQSHFSGGANFNYYVEAPITDYRTARSLVRKLVNNTSLPFISISPTIYECPVCGKRTDNGEWCSHEVTEEEYKRLVDSGKETRVHI